jgi:transcriptional regulator of acetoin/glycerol metabolism
VIQPTDLPPELVYGLTQYQPSDALCYDEKHRLLTAIEQAHGNRRRAARLLGMSKSTLYRRLTRFHIPLKPPLSHVQ